MAENPSKPTKRPRKPEKRVEEGIAAAEPTRIAMTPSLGQIALDVAEMKRQLQARLAALETAALVRELVVENRRMRDRLERIEAEIGLDEPDEPRKPAPPALRVVR